MMLTGRGTVIFRWAIPVVYRISVINKSQTQLDQVFFLLLHRALWNLYIVHSPTNALFIKLGKV